MSFEFFLDTIADAPGVTKDQLRHAFGVQPVEENPELWRVEYDDFTGFHLFLTPDVSDKERIVGICVWRPVKDTAFGEGLLSVMRAGGFFLYVAGNCPPLVADPAQIRRVPAAYVAALGNPVCVEGWDDLCEIIRKS